MIYKPFNNRLLIKIRLNHFLINLNKNNDFFVNF